MPSITRARLQQLNNSAFFVTGGASGLGEATVRMIVSSGGRVVIADVNEAAGARLARELGPAARFEVVDVTDEASVQRGLGAAAQFGALRGVVNAAGIAIAEKVLEKHGPHPLDAFMRVIRINLAGTFNVTQKAAAILRKDGRIVNLSSVSGQMGLFGQANYSSSKAAIIALTKVSAREFARQNITVNAIAPGFIDIGMSKGMADEVAENFKRQVPLGRLGQVGEIVDAALFLASPMASYITGHVLNVNGGMLMG